MRPFTAPAVLAVLGALIFAATSLEFSRQARAKATDQPFSLRVLLVLPLIVAAYALFGVLRAIWGGHETWWAWLAALAVDLVAVHHGQRSRERFFEATAFERLAPPAEALTRTRFTWLFFALAFGALLAVARLLPSGGAEAAVWRVVASALLFVVSMVSLCAATWSSVWVFRAREHQREP
jgi:hypothetical protein